VAGFTSGEGHFQVAFAKNRYSHLTFKINRHDRDEHLMKSLIEYWGCGNYYPSEKRGDYIVSKFSHITGILIPFFKENPILGVKALDFQD
jgi:hypothetical protein